MIDRYSRPAMRRIWTPENKFQKWLMVEVLACEAWAALGEIPPLAVEAIRQHLFTVDEAFVRRVEEIERETRHDVIAFTTAVAERLGEPARYIHYGLTSTDVVDTAQAVVIVEALALIEEGLERFALLLRRRAIEHKDTVMIGRTHGVHAEPTSLGLKFALWWQEVERDLERIRRARRVMSVGKLSGAVGTFANIDPFVEEYVCQRLGLEPAPVSTQVLQRDRHAEMMAAIAITGGTLEKIALEIRLLQRTEGREVEEPFRQGQKGSSAMPHKRNPVTAEQITGLARVLRGNAIAAMENQALWHERDISHSSVERIILPDSTMLLDYLVAKSHDLIENLHIYPENMRKVLRTTGGLIFSQQVLLALVEKGLAREEAYRIVQAQAMAAWAAPPTFQERIAADPEVLRHLSPAEIAACFDETRHLSGVNAIFSRLGLLGDEED